MNEGWSIIGVTLHSIFNESFFLRPVKERSTCNSFSVLFPRIKSNSLQTTTNPILAWREARAWLKQQPRHCQIATTFRNNNSCTKQLLCLVSVKLHPVSARLHPVPVSVKLHPVRVSVKTEIRFTGSWALARSRRCTCSSRPFNNSNCFSKHQVSLMISLITGGLQLGITVGAA